MNIVAVRRSVPLYSFLYSNKCSFHHRQVLRLIHTSLAMEKFFHEKPSERDHGPVFMLERRELMVFRCSDNTPTFWSRGQATGLSLGGLTHAHAILRVGCDVTKARNAAQPRGRQPEGVRNTKNKHSHRRQQTLIATTLCAFSIILATTTLHETDQFVTFSAVGSQTEEEADPGRGTSMITTTPLLPDSK